MSGESFLDQYFSGSPSEHGSDSQRKNERMGVAESYVASLDLHLSDGTRLALPYSMLLRIVFDASVGVTLDYTADTVTITGYRLEPLYKAIAQRRLSEIKVVGERAGMFDQEESGPVVTKIRRRPVEE